VLTSALVTIRRHHPWPLASDDHHCNPANHDAERSLRRETDSPLGTTRSPGTIVPPAIASLRPPSAARCSQTSFPPRFGNRVVSQLRNPLVSPKKPLPPNSLAWNQTYGLAMSALCMQMAATKKAQFDSQAWAHQGRGSRFLVGQYHPGVPKESFSSQFISHGADRGCVKPQPKL
jgi:hypothetical protein